MELDSAWSSGPSGHQRLDSTLQPLRCSEALPAGLASGDPLPRRGLSLAFAQPKSETVSQPRTGFTAPGSRTEPLAHGPLCADMWATVRIPGVGSEAWGPRVSSWGAVGPWPLHAPLLGQLRWLQGRLESQPFVNEVMGSQALRRPKGGLLPRGAPQLPHHHLGRAARRGRARPGPGLPARRRWNE